MSMAVTTSRVACPRCGEGATLTVRTEFGDGPGSSQASLHCGTGCQPDDDELGNLFGLQGIRSRPNGEISRHEDAEAGAQLGKPRSQDFLA